MKEGQSDGICHLLAEEKFTQYLLRKYDARKHLEYLAVDGGDY
jgi:hypothetical protein